MSVQHLVVVGASLTGLRAVEAARKDGFTGRITLIGAEPHLPYDRPPLSKAFLERAEGHDTPESVRFRTDEMLRDELGVELMLGTPATALDAAGKAVTVGDRQVPYDALVIATGARARWLPAFDGLDGVHVLRTLDDAEAIRHKLDAGARTVVVGAGFIGSEIASSARKLGAQVTIVEALPVPLVRAIGETMGASIAQLHHLNKTPLLCGVTVDAVEGNGSVERVVLSNDETIPADLVVVGAGAIPNVEWLEGSAVTLDNGVVCDENLFTGVPGVYAAGDVANWPNPQFDGARMRMENWTAAAEQGATAAKNALHPEAPRAYRTVPYFWSDWYGSRIQFVGITHAEQITVVEDDLAGSGHLVALYTEGDRLIGALTVNRPTEIMKYRGMIMKGTSAQDARAFAEKRSALHRNAV